MSLLLLTIASLALLAAAGLLYQTLGTRADRRRFPPLGSLVNAHGRQVHLLQAGEGSPAVIFESGIAASVLNWTNIQAAVARFTSASAYDRASLGWSESARTPRITSRLLAELHALMTAAHIPTPCILVGHSFGGLLARAYAVNYPAQIAGLVLIDPLHSAEWLAPSAAQLKMLRHGVMLSRRGALLARFGIVRLSLALLSSGARRIPKLVARLSSGHGESTISRLVGEVQKMPPEVWPMVQTHWCQPRCFSGMADYLESLPTSAAESAALPPELAGIPVMILSAANSSPAQLSEREAIAHHSRQGKHLVVANSGHWIHLDQPDAVIQAIREMVELVRGDRKPG